MLDKTTLLIVRKIAIDEIERCFLKDFTDDYDLGRLVGMIHAYSVTGVISDLEYKFLINAIYEVC